MFLLDCYAQPSAGEVRLALANFEDIERRVLMSIYAVVQETIRSNPGLTAAQIAAKTGSDQIATDPMVQQLVTEGRVVQTGATFSTATFAAATPPKET